MRYLIDSNIAIHVRDGDRAITTRLFDLGALPALSLVSLIELYGGLGTDVVARERRKMRIDRLLGTIRVLDLDQAAAEHYRLIVERLGFSRPRILDRLIAATAIVTDLTLITINGADSATFPTSSSRSGPLALNNPSTP